MRKLFITSAAAIMAVIPSFAETGIPAGTSNPGCTEPVLGVSSGTTNLQAEYDPNTINLTYYSDGNEVFTPSNETATTCTYNESITIPTNRPEKTGYTFGGWKLRVAQCMSGLDTSINGTAYGYTRLNGDAGENESTYGLTQGSGEWATTFSYGTVKGMAKCSAKSGDNHNLAWGGNSSDWTATESELTSASGEARYCWCQATNYTPTNGNQCSVASPAWVFNVDTGAADNCAHNCALDCAYYVRNKSVFRVALFGGAGA